MADPTSLFAELSEQSRAERAEVMEVFLRGRVRAAREGARRGRAAAKGTAGRGDEARPLLTRALEGYGAYFAADHPDVVALEARLAGDLAPLAPGQGHRPRSTHRKGRGSRRSKVPPASSGVPEAPRAAPPPRLSPRASPPPSPSEQPPPRGAPLPPPRPPRYRLRKLCA